MLAQKVETGVLRTSWIARVAILLSSGLDCDCRLSELGGEAMEYDLNISLGQLHAPKREWPSLAKRGEKSTNIRVSESLLGLFNPWLLLRHWLLAVITVSATLCISASFGSIGRERERKKTWCFDQGYFIVKKELFTITWEVAQRIRLLASRS